ncbi:hypothetical protein BH23PLA1_BH23PLA1_39290 [soil metagenome]
MSELLSTWDAEKGGPIAVDLASLYTFLLGELIDQGIHPDAAKLDRLIGIVADHLLEADARLEDALRAARDQLALGIE